MPASGEDTMPAPPHAAAGRPVSTGVVRGARLALAGFLPTVRAASNAVCGGA
jgi:hypothetical protein